MAADINRLKAGDAASPGDILTGYEDWSHLKYNFRDSPDYADGVHTTYQRQEEPVTDFISSAMQVSGNATLIDIGDVTPDPVDATDLGGVQTVSSLTRTFTVQNPGNYVLTLTGTPVVQVTGPNAADFTVTVQPGGTVAAFGGATTFQVKFAPAALGARSATISIASSQGDANPYTFAIAGTGLTPVDTDGDGCWDVKEPLLVPPTDSNNQWDFYNVPAPALFAAPNPLIVFKDHIVGAADAQAVFGYFKKAAKTGSVEYEQDLNANGIIDGIEYDRSIVIGSPGASGPPNGIVAAADAQLAFAQFKHTYKC